MIKNERTIFLGIDFDGAPVQGDNPLFVSRMLEWIDTLYLQGWNGKMEQFDNFSKETNASILELAALEKASRNRVSPGIGQRLLNLSAVLDGGINLPLDNQGRSTNKSILK
jgi:hypothetical protein